MAGQPRRMAERATQLEAMTYVCAGEVFLAAPRKYLPTNEQPDDRPSDPVSQRWRQCIELSMMLSIKTLELANLLRAKANLPAIVNDDDDPPSNGKLEPQPAG